MHRADNRYLFNSVLGLTAVAMCGLAGCDSSFSASGRPSPFENFNLARGASGSVESCLDDSPNPPPSCR